MVAAREEQNIPVKIKTSKSSTFGKSLYYFSNGGVIEWPLYSGMQETGILLIVLFLIWLLFGVTFGAVGGAEFGGFFAVITMVLSQSLIGGPRERKADALTFNQLKTEKGARFTPWAGISKITVKGVTTKGNKTLELDVSNKKYALCLLGDEKAAVKLFESELGKKFHYPEELAKLNVGTPRESYETWKNKHPELVGVVEAENWQRYKEYEESETKPKK